MNTDANKEQRALEHIQSVVDKLLDPEGGCPWDRAQTPVSLCEYIIEECHELVDATRIRQTPDMPVTKWEICSSCSSSPPGALPTPEVFHWPTP